MTDGELKEAIASTNGRVFIGIKESDATDGVDPYGRTLVSSATLMTTKQLLRSLGVVVEYELKTIPAIIANVSNEFVGVVRANPRVDYIEPVLSGSPSSQITTWSATAVQAPDAWSYSTGSGVKILIIDSGAPQSHEDLTTAVAFRCVDPQLPTFDQLGHGTAVAGVAAALNNSVGLVGVSYGVSVWSANVANVNGGYDNGEIVCAVDVGRQNGIFAYNMSFESFENTSLNDAIHAAYYQDGSLIVAAAGNSNGGAVKYPASLSEVIAVTSVNALNERSYYSPIDPKVELSAPGESIWTTYFAGATACGSGSSYTYCSGTSMAAPHVTAAAATLKAYNSSWSNVFIRARLDSTAMSLGAASSFGHGLLQVYNAIRNFQ